MKIEVGRPFHAQGDAEIPEDNYAICPVDPLRLIIADGVSGLYLPQEGPRIFRGLSGGQLASQIAAGMFSVSDVEKIETKIADINEDLRHVVQREQLSLEEPEFLPSTTFLALETSEVDGRELLIRMISAGDCLAFWKSTPQPPTGMVNTMFQYDSILLQKMAELMQDVPGKTLKQKRQNMWTRFRPFLAEKRRNAINQKGGYALLNGQPIVEQFLYEGQHPMQFCELHIPLHISRFELVLCTDGAIPFELTKSPNQAAEYIFHYLEQSGPKAVVRETWKRTTKKAWESHISRPEATIIPIVIKG